MNFAMGIVRWRPIVVRYKVVKIYNVYLCKMFTKMEGG